MSPGNGGSGHVCSHQLPAAIFEENSVKGNHSLEMFVFNEYLSMNEFRWMKDHRHIIKSTKIKEDLVYNFRFIHLHQCKYTTIKILQINVFILTISF